MPVVEIVCVTILVACALMLQWVLYEGEQQTGVTLFVTLLTLDVFEARKGDLLELLRRTSIFVFVNLTDGQQSS